MIEHMKENGSHIQVGQPWYLKRIALNYDQVQQYNPPPNPAKLTDSRAEEYISNFGYESWELDALEPRVLQNLIQDEIDALRDEEVWASSVEAMDADLEALKDIVASLAPAEPTEGAETPEEES
jgi:hypothetical protein